MAYFLVSQKAVKQDDFLVEADTKEQAEEIAQDNCTDIDCTEFEITFDAMEVSKEHFETQVRADTIFQPPSERNKQ